MIRPRSSVLTLALIAVFAAPAGAQPSTPTVDPFPPPPEACLVAPRDPVALRALLASLPPHTSTPSAAPPGNPLADFPREVPDGNPVDPATTSAIAATLREHIACLNAGDIARFLALYSDDAIRNTPSLARLATAVADQALPRPESTDATQRRRAPGLFHARMLPDGRITAVSPPGFLGFPELYTFVLADGRWLIDDHTPLLAEADLPGVVGNTFTDERRVSENGRRFGGYGYGLEWGPEWLPIPERAFGFRDFSLALTDGTNIVVIGAPMADPDAPLADCAALPGNETVFKRRYSPLHPAFFDTVAGIAPAVAPDGQPLRGSDSASASAVYEVGYRPAGVSAEAEPYRLHLECYAMAGGAWRLSIAFLSPAAAYAAGVSSLESITATIEGK